jgi:hypothetical protein
MNINNQNIEFINSYNYEISMLKYIPEYQKKRFLLNSFVYLRIGVAIGIFVSLILARLFDITPTLGEVIFISTVISLACVISIINFYHKLSGMKDK